MDYLEAIKEFDGKMFMGAYLFYGDERFLFESLMGKVEKMCEGSFSQFNLSVFSGADATVRDIIDSCEMLPIGQDYRFVVVKESLLFSKGSSSKDDVELLESYLDKPNPTTVLVFEGVNVDRSNKLFKLVHKKNGDVELSKVESAMFSKWVQKQFKENGKRIDKATLKLFVDDTGYCRKDSAKTLIEIKNEIDRVCSKTLDSDVKADDFKEITGNALFKSVFDMVDMIGMRNSDMSVRIYRDLISKDKDPREIFPLIVRHFRILKRVKNLIENNRSQSELESVYKSFNLPKFTHRKYMEQTNYFDERMLDRIIGYAADVDYRSKRFSTNFERELETLIIKLCKISSITS
jgi:DNA polymerase III subunit delta